MSNIHSESVSYSTNGDVMNSYLAYDSDIDGKRPGVLVVPEWWGLNDYIRGRAEQLAALGYSAMAIDMYGDGKTAQAPDEANAMRTAVLERSISRHRFVNLVRGDRRTSLAYWPVLNQNVKNLVRGPAPSMSSEYRRRINPVRSLPRIPKSF